MSLRRIRVQASVAVVLIGLLFGFQAVIAQSVQKGAIAGGVKVDGPLVQENLAIYVVRGKPTDARKYITLDEACVRRPSSFGSRGRDPARIGPRSTSLRSRTNPTSGSTFRRGT